MQAGRHPWKALDNVPFPGPFPHLVLSKLRLGSDALFAGNPLDYFHSLAPASNTSRVVCGPFFASPGTSPRSAAAVLPTLESKEVSEEDSRRRNGSITLVCDLAAHM